MVLSYIKSLTKMRIGEILLPCLEFRLEGGQKHPLMLLILLSFSENIQRLSNGLNRVCKSRHVTPRFHENGSSSTIQMHWDSSLT